MFKFIAAALTALALAQPAQAHGGGLNRQGCHNNHSTGTYHCHRAQHTQRTEVVRHQNNHSDAGAILFGVITGIILNEAINADNHRDQRHQNQDWNRRCGWYEEAERAGNRIYYYRYNSCNHRLIGERWEYRHRR